MPCVAIKHDSHVCGRQPAPHLHPEDHPHLDLCGIHAAAYRRNYRSAGNVHHRQGKCLQFERRQWCPHDALDGRVLCANHQTRVDRALARQQAVANRRALIADLENDATQRGLTWQEATRELFGRIDLPILVRRDAARRHYRRIVMIRNEDWVQFGGLWAHDRYWNWLLNGADPANPPDLVNPPVEIPAIVIPPPGLMGGLAPPPPRAQPELARIAADRQNVHTAAVTRQTNEMEKKLLEVVVPREQQTEHVIAREWLTGPTQYRWIDMLRTMADMHKWFIVKTCRRTDDYLYRNLLRGVAAKISQIESPEVKSELFKRLLQECVESVGMCCEGHISRLCNVFVGFDETFKSPVSIGDVMQEKMSAIAALDLPLEERLAQARAWFDEHAVPEPERASWLLAIESL